MGTILMITKPYPNSSVFIKFMKMLAVWFWKIVDGLKNMFDKIIIGIAAIGAGFVVFWNSNKWLKKSANYIRQPEKNESLPVPVTNLNSSTQDIIATTNNNANSGDNLYFQNEQAHLNYQQPAFQDLPIDVQKSFTVPENMKEHCARLGLSLKFTFAELRSQFKKLAIKTHPDKSDAINAKEIFQKLHNSYETLWNCIRSSNLLDQYLEKLKEEYDKEFRAYIKILDDLAERQKETIESANKTLARGDETIKEAKSVIKEAETTLATGKKIAQKAQNYIENIRQRNKSTK
jgi:hypothetical protein